MYWKIQRKQELLLSIMQHYRHVDFSVIYLLNVIYRDPVYMNKMVFSEQVQHAPRGLYFSFGEDDEHPFVYYKHQMAFYDSEQAFHDLRINRRYSDRFYLEFDIPNYLPILYEFGLFEENPHLPHDLQAKERINANLLAINQEVQFLGLQDQIDAALEARNYDEVERLLEMREQWHDGR